MTNNILNLILNKLYIKFPIYIKKYHKLSLQKTPPTPSPKKIISYITYSETCTKRSSPPSSGVINPCPRSLQNCLIVPYRVLVFSILSDLHFHEK